MKSFIKVNERVTGWSRIKLHNEYINMKFVTSIRFKDQEVELSIGDARNNQTRKYIVTERDMIEKITDYLI